jgi:hypothetical protein
MVRHREQMWSGLDFPHPGLSHSMHSRLTARVGDLSGMGCTVCSSTGEYNDCSSSNDLVDHKLSNTYGWQPFLLVVTGNENFHKLCSGLLKNLPFHQLFSIHVQAMR